MSSLTSNLSLDEATAEWRRVVLARRNVHPREALDTVNFIVGRARILAATNRLNFLDVAGFLLDRTLSWALAGKTMGEIKNKLPVTLGDLGMLKIVEGGSQGEPLEMSELKRALAAPKIILH